MRQVLGLLLLVLVGSMLPVPVGAQSCVTPPSGLGGWWPGDGNGADIIGANNGTLMNGATFAPGKVGQAFSFDGVDDYVDLGNHASLRVASGPFTLDVWIKTTVAAGRAGIIAQSVEANTFYSLEMNVFANDGRVYFGLGDGFCPNSWLPSMVPVADGNWHHIVGVHDGLGNQYIYIDGTLSNSKTESCGSLDTSFNVYIGRTYSGGLYFNGLIDEPTLYHRALSAAEIQAIFDAGSAGKCKTADLAACQTSLAQATQTIQNQQTQITQLQSQISPLQTQLSQAQQQNTQLQSQITQFNAAVSNLRDQVSSLTTQNTQLQGQVSTLTQQNAQLQSQVNFVTQQNTQLQNQVTTLTQQNTQLQSQVNSVTQQNGQLQSLVTTLTQQNTQLQSQLNQVNTTLHNGLTSIQSDLRNVSSSPSFTLPGSTPLEQYQNLVNAILGLNTGRKRGLYENLGGLLVHSAYVTNAGSNTVSVIDTGSNAVVATVAVGYNPDNVAISPDGSRAYVTKW